MLICSTLGLSLLLGSPSWVAEEAKILSLQAYVNVIKAKANTNEVKIQKLKESMTVGLPTAQADIAYLSTTISALQYQIDNIPMIPGPSRSSGAGHYGLSADGTHNPCVQLIL